MSVRMALAKLCACTCGGAVIGGGAVHVAENPIPRPAIVKSAKAKTVTHRVKHRPKRVKRIKRIVRECRTGGAAAAAGAVTTRTITYPAPPIPLPPPMPMPMTGGGAVPVVIGGGAVGSGFGGGFFS